jgi:rod shape-determining protein MreB
MFNKLLSRISQDIAIDLGTATSLVYVRGRGIVIQEPSVVAINQKTGQVLAIGEEAKKMVGRTPAHIIATRPLVSGVISDFEVTEQMLRYFIDKVDRKRFFLNPRPRVIVGIPCGVTEVEKKAVRDATENAGAGKVFLIEEPMAAAIGARLEIQEAGGNFIVDIGGGTTEVAVISLGGIVLAKSLRIAGDKLNEDIIHFAQNEYKLLIGERTAEEIKIGIGSACVLKNSKLSNTRASAKGGDEARASSTHTSDTQAQRRVEKNECSLSKNGNPKREMPMRGRNLVTGLPEEITVTEEEIRKAMEKSVRLIIEEIKSTIEETPPELLADIMSKGIQMAGGGSLLRGIDFLIAKETKIPTKIIEDPMTAVVRGAGMVLENLDELSDILVETEYLEPPK